MKVKNLCLLVCLIVGFISCRKAEPNPCELMLTIAPSNPVLVKFVDAQSKKTIVPQKSQFKIINNQTRQLLQNWEIYNSVNTPVSDTTLASRLTGALIIPLMISSAGEHGFTLESDSLGTFMLSLRATEEKTNEPCIPYTYALKEVKITNHPFYPLQHSGRTYPEILVVEL